MEARHSGERVEQCAVNRNRLLAFLALYYNRLRRDRVATRLHCAPNIASQTDCTELLVGGFGEIKGKSDSKLKVARQTSAVDGIDPQTPLTHAAPYRTLRNPRDCGWDKAPPTPLSAQTAATRRSDQTAETSTGVTCQMSRAYSAMVRSELNRPVRAIFTSALRLHAA